MNSTSLSSGLSPQLLWAILLLACVFVGLPVAGVGFSVWISTRRGGLGSSEAAARRARNGRLGGLATGAIAGLLALYLGNGTLAPVLVAAGFLAGVLATELQPTQRPSGSVRVASLQARDAWRYLPRWVVPGTIATGTLAILAPVWFALSPWDQAGSRGALVWLSIPLAIAAGLALVGWVMLIGRVTDLPQAAGPDADQDSATRDRKNAARAIAGAVLGIELVVLGAQAISASGALPDTGGLYLSSRVLVWVGLGLALAGLVLWSAMSRWRAQATR
jgi:hypothetical protein